MIFDLQKQLLSFARHVEGSAELLRDAVCEGCRPCTSEISDLHRQMLSELADTERALIGKDSPHALTASHALASCVSHAFCAAMLLPASLPVLPPLGDAVCAAALLASYPGQILTSPQTVPFYQLHLCANKGRGAHAILITHYCTRGSGHTLLPLALALEAHRNELEHTCGILMEVSRELMAHDT